MKRASEDFSLDGFIGVYPPRHPAWDLERYYNLNHLYPLPVLIQLHQDPLAVGRSKTRRIQRVHQRLMQSRSSAVDVCRGSISRHPRAQRWPPQGVIQCPFLRGDLRSAASVLGGRRWRWGVMGLGVGHLYRLLLRAAGFVMCVLISYCSWSYSLNSRSSPVFFGHNKYTWAKLCISYVSSSPSSTLYVIECNFKLNRFLFSRRRVSSGFDSMK